MNNLVIEEQREAYQVVTNSDLTEGKGRSVVLGTYWNPVSAKRNAVGRGVMGSPAQVYEVTALRVGRKWYIPGEIIPPSKLEVDQYEKDMESIRIEQRMLASGFSKEDILKLKGKAL